MDIQKIIRSALFSCLSILLTAGLAVACSDDKEEQAGSEYGYVQFKLYKAASYAAKKTADTGRLEKLSDVGKVEIEMLYNGLSITQTLVVSAYSDEHAEYGLTSDKLQLLTGTYRIVSYKLLDRLDNPIMGVPATGDETFSVVSRGLTVKDLTVNAQPRGTVTFKLVKQGLKRATEESYLFSNIKIVDVTVTNTFTREQVTFEGLKVEYEEEAVEHPNEDDPEDDKYMDIGTAQCDSAVWLNAGNYRVTSYTTYSKTGSMVRELETQDVTGETFTVEDNRETTGAPVPILLSETAEYIKDYRALRAIWEALDGKNWNHGNSGWTFNKELDMWGDQPGVTLDANGRVTGLSLEGMGAKGRVPDAIGQLTELRVLALGSHEERTGGNLFAEDGANAFMSEARRREIRMSYKRKYLDYDIREGFSELLQEGFSRDLKQGKVVKSNRITLKDTQIGNLSNHITFVSKAIMRLTNLQQLYISNAPLKAADICAGWENPDSEFARQYEGENLSWSNMKELTDLEVYNLPKMERLPDFLFELPEVQLLNLACNRGIPGDRLVADWSRLAQSPVGGKIQILYLGYNNLERMPEDGSIRKMKKLGMLDCTYNKIKGKLPAFGPDIRLATLSLDYNEIEEIPEDFCGFTDEVESLSFTHNKLKYIPNIFDAGSVYVMGSVDFSYNEIGADGHSIDPNTGTYKGINASTVSLSNNKISKFPTELFAAGSPIESINLSNNLMTEIPENSLRSKDGNFKNTYLLQIIDLRFNKLTSLSDDFRANTLPYLSNMDVSYNCFSRFPYAPLNSSQLKAFGIRHQRDEAGNRTLREWPEGVTTCPSLLQLQIGSNDIRKVNETLTPYLYILEIKDNPNLSIDVTSVCPYIEMGAYLLIYDKTQDIRGCDALEIQR